MDFKISCCNASNKRNYIEEKRPFADKKGCRWWSTKLPLTRKRAGAVFLAAFSACYYRVEMVVGVTRFALIYYIHFLRSVVSVFCEKGLLATGWEAAGSESGVPIGR